MISNLQNRGCLIVDRPKNRKEAGFTQNMGKYTAHEKENKLFYRVFDPIYELAALHFFALTPFKAIFCVLAIQRHFRFG